MFENLCRNAALLVEGERMAEVGSWERDVFNGDLVCSANLSAMLGISSSNPRMSGRAYWELIHADDREMVSTIIDCALKDRLPYYEHQARFVLPSRQERVLFTHAELTFDSSNRLVRWIGVTRDATMTVEMCSAFRASERMLRLSEEELHRLSSRLLEFQDNERRAVSLALHENVSQSLSGVLMCAEAIAGSADLPTSLLGALERCQSITSDAIANLNSLSHLLHPPLLEEGLSFAIAWHVSRFAKSTGIDVSVEIPDDLGRLPEHSERAIFRIIEECLKNIKSHSGSRCARINVGRHAGGITLVVQDGGKGLSDELRRDPDSNHWNFGIPVMRERIRQLHGSLSIETSAQGVVVRAIVPVPEIDFRIDKIASIERSSIECNLSDMDACNQENLK